MLVMADSFGAHEPTPFHESLPHLPPDAQRDEQLEYLGTWEMVYEIESGAFALTDYDFEAPRAVLDVLKALPESHSHADYEVFDFPGSYVKPDRGEALAMIRLEEAKATAQRALANGNARGLLVGWLFTLRDHPQADVNRDYLVVSQTTALRGHARESGGSEPGLLDEHQPRRHSERPSVSPTAHHARSRWCTARRQPRWWVRRVKRSGPTNSGE